MARSILGVIVGYLVMAAIVFGSLTAAYLLMGADRAFKPGLFEVTTTWLATSFVLGFIAALVGGVVCAVIARKRKAAYALAALVVLIGAGLAVYQGVESGEITIPGQEEIAAAPSPSAEPPRVRTADVGSMEAMQHAETPDWVLWINPLLGAVGVLLGAGMAEGAAAGSRKKR